MSLFSHTYFIRTAGLLGLLLLSFGFWWPPTQVTHAQIEAFDNARGGTEVGGDINSDTTWTAAGSPYLMTSNVIVKPNVTLTIQPGVLVQARGSNRVLRVEGHLEAAGAENNGITFTSEADTDGNQWSGLYFTGGGTGHLDYVTVRYGGGDNFNTNIYIENIRTGGEVRISNSQILNAGNDANPAYAMAIEATELPRVRLEDNTFSGNQTNRVVVMEGTVASSATLAPQTGLEGYELYGQLTVGTDATLTVEPGTTVMGRNESNPGFYDDHILVVGHLNAEGTADKPIMFTSAVDTDGSQWGGIYFNGGSGHLNHVTVRYAGRGFYVTSPRTNIYIENVRPDKEVLIENSQILNAGNEAEPAYAMAIEATQLPQLRLVNNTFSQNRLNRVLIIEGTVASNATLLAQTELDGYELYGQLTVSTGITLTVTPGTTVMARYEFVPGFYDDHIQVMGHLDAVGTADNPITFTSAWETDGNQWGGIYFNGGSGHLNHVTVRYGGRGFSSTSPHANIYVRDVRAGEEVLIENSQILNAGTADNSAYGIVIEAIQLPQVRLLNNTFSGNWPNRVRISEGTVASDATLLPQASGLEGYEVYGTLTVGADATLTVEPGTTVMGRYESVPGFYDDHIQVVGHLQAVGTASNPIIFTSAWDTDSNEWGGIYFNGGSGHLNHATVRYGGRGFSSTSPRANVYVRDVTDGEQVLIENSQISQSGSDGLHVNNGQVKVHCSTFTSNGEDGITINSAGTPDFSILGSEITNNSGYGLNNASGTQANARYNWWGDASGPGSGVTGDVLIEPWLSEAECVVNLSLSTPPSQAGTPGEVMTYIHQIANNGPGSATGVVFTAQLPEDVTFVSATFPDSQARQQPSYANCTESGGTVTCNLGDMAIGAQKAVTMEVIAGEQSFNTTINATANETDYSTSNNSGTPEIPVISPDQGNTLYLPLVIR